MSGLHWFFYNFGALTGISSGVCAAVLMVWTLRGARRSAVYRCTIALMLCLALTMLCILGMKLT